MGEGGEVEGGGGREGSEIAEVRAKKRLSEEEREREKNDCFHDYNGTEEEKGWREKGWPGKRVWGAIS